MPDRVGFVRRLDIDGRYKERKFCVRSAIFVSADWLNEKRKRKEKRRRSRSRRRRSERKFAAEEMLVTSSQHVISEYTGRRFENS